MEIELIVLLELKAGRAEVIIAEELREGHWPNRQRGLNILWAMIPALASSRLGSPRYLLEVMWLAIHDSANGNNVGNASYDVV
jgi:hypothetical protein